MSDFKVFEYELHTKKLPAASRGFTFVLLADLHNHVYGPENERLLAAIHAQKPDAVLVAGDMLVAKKGQSFAPALQLFIELRKAGYPVFYGNGNHEYRMRIHPEEYGSMYPEYMGALRELGVTVLENERAVLENENGRVNIYGFELEHSYYKKFCRKELSKGELLEALGRVSEEEYNILLAHNPVYFDTYAAWGADVTLSGHLHGGIIRLPLLGGLITPQARLFPKYDAGQFKRDGRDLIVSRGLGTHTVNVRILNPAELSVLHLHRD